MGWGHEIQFERSASGCAEPELDSSGTALMFTRFTAPLMISPGFENLCFILLLIHSVSI